MSDENIIVVKRVDGKFVQVLPDGSTQPLVDETDWARVNSMTDEEVHAAALSDPDAQPLTDERLKTMRRVPRARTLRWALSLTQEEFAERYRIPIGMLRDWEEGRSEPDQPAAAYLKVIAHDPEGVLRALSGRRAGPHT